MKTKTKRKNKISYGNDRGKAISAGFNFGKAVADLIRNVADRHDAVETKIRLNASPIETLILKRFLELLEAESDRSLSLRGIEFGGGAPHAPISLLVSLEGGDIDETNEKNARMKLHEELEKVLDQIRIECYELT